MMNLILSLTKSLSYTIIWILFLTLSCVLSYEELHMRCFDPFDCGNQRTLSYPFWKPGRDECGHPDFEVNCIGDFAEFTISSVRFRILEMNSSIIELARMDYLNNLCSQYPVNTTIIQEVLPLHPDTQLLTFYYNCSSSRIDVNDYIRKINCEDGTGGQSYLAIPSNPRNRITLDDINDLCNRCFNIPVSRYALGKAERNQSLQEALAEVFTLDVNSECLQCLQSKGSCGYNKSLGEFMCYCINGPRRHTCYEEGSEKKGLSRKGLSKKARIGIGFSFGFLGATLLIIGCLLCFIIRRRKKQAAQYKNKGLSETPYSSNNILSTTSTSTTISASNHSFLTRKRGSLHYPIHHNLEALVQLKQYSYEEVEKITKSFSYTVGKGGFGTVYGGNLSDGRKVAVKILRDLKSNGEDFINEVASMSQTSHVNIVSLLGFCYEGSKRAIVYEFLENGSLDEFISSKNSLNLNVGTLYGIALGVARGLEYLHHGCKTRIVHFDIKPQNVLLDDNLCPKVSDFGLARLCEKRESILSLLDARGTIGYIAPEVFSRMYGRVSHKSDVYSYGMLIFEMIGERNEEPTASNLSSAYFPDWIYKHLENGEYTLKYGDEITTEEKEIAKKMIMVGLWCIQQCPSNRPPMNKVVKMMEGSLDALEVPPKSSFHFSSMALPESSSLSEENSNYSEVLL